jgi:hypothetical protein
MHRRYINVAGWLFYKHFGQPFRPQYMNAMDRECASDQGPVGFNKAQRPGDRNIPDVVPHDVDLFEHPIDQFRAITSADEELLDAGAKDATLDLQFRPSLVPFGVDDPDSTGSDGYVVDVGLRSGDASVVKDGQAISGQGIQPSAEAFLANRASIPGLGALALVREDDCDAAEWTPLLAEPFLVFRFATLILASG